MMRGKEPPVNCDNCGRVIPRNKAVVDEKTIRFGTDLHNSNDVKFLAKRKVYYCISCAKHKGIFEKKREFFQNRREHGQGSFYKRE